MQYGNASEEFFLGEREIYRRPRSLNLRLYSSCLYSDALKFLLGQLCGANKFISNVIEIGTLETDRGKLPQSDCDRKIYRDQYNSSLPHYIDCRFGLDTWDDKMICS